METVFKFFLSAILTVLIMWVVDLTGHWIAWWAAAAISLVLVFGGFLILDDDADWFA